MGVKKQLIIVNWPRESSAASESVRRIFATKVDEPVMNINHETYTYTYFGQAETAVNGGVSHPRHSRKLESVVIIIIYTQQLGRRVVAINGWWHVLIMRMINFIESECLTSEYFFIVYATVLRRDFSRRFIFFIQLQLIIINLHGDFFSSFPINQTHRPERVAALAATTHELSAQWWLTRWTDHNVTWTYCDYQTFFFDLHRAYILEARRRWMTN